MEFQSHSPCKKLFFKSGRQTGITLTQETEIHRQFFHCLIHTLNIPGSRCTGCCICPSGRSCAASQHGSDSRHKSFFHLLWTNEMDMSIQCSCSCNLSFACNGFCSGTDNDVNIGLDIRVSGFSNSNNATRFNSNIGLNDSPMIED